MMEWLTNLIHFVGWELVEEAEILGPQCQFAYNKSGITCSGIELESLATDHLSDREIGIVFLDALKEKYFDSMSKYCKSIGILV
jgi:hypothetical protein